MCSQEISDKDSQEVFAIRTSALAMFLLSLMMLFVSVNVVLNSSFLPWWFGAAGVALAALGLWWFSRVAIPVQPDSGGEALPEDNGTDAGQGLMDDTRH